MLDGDDIAKLASVTWPVARDELRDLVVAERVEKDRRDVIAPSPEEGHELPNIVSTLSKRRHGGLRERPEDLRVDGGLGRHAAVVVVGADETLFAGGGQQPMLLCQFKFSDRPNDESSATRCVVRLRAMTGSASIPRSTCPF